MTWPELSDIAIHYARIVHDTVYLEEYVILNNILSFYSFYCIKDQ